MIALQTLVYREFLRFIRIWPQTLLPPIITTILYFIIFGNLIGDRIGGMEGFSYAIYIAPGLIMMSVINNSYANVVSSFFSAKFHRYIEEMLISPMPHSILLLGYMLGGMMRGLCVGGSVFIVSVLFTGLHIQHPWVALLVLLLTTAVFSLAGLINSVYAKTFDDISIVPTFILTPMVYLGGVFYSISMLPAFWQKVSYFNPMLYMINSFRYSFLGTSDIPLAASLAILMGLAISLYGVALYLIYRGVGLKS